MSRRHRHHRKIKPSTPLPVRDAQEQAIVKESKQEMSLGSQATLSIVRHDLWQTVIITLVLAAILVGLSLTNSRHNWTLGFGSTLYRLLHIR